MAWMRAPTKPNGWITWDRRWGVRTDRAGRRNRQRGGTHRAQSDGGPSRKSEGVERAGLRQPTAVPDPEFCANKPVDLLIGPGIEATDLNDDSLGRALDRLFEVGVTEVFARVAARALRVFQMFEGIDLLLIDGSQSPKRRVLNLTDLHRRILHLLGPPVERCYLLTSAL
jgi:hypothetical protein